MALGLWLFRCLRPREGEVDVRMSRGHVMRLPANSSQTWTPAFTGRYDDEEIALISRFITPSSLVLDVGASLGLYTIPLARIAAPLGSRVAAFEPIPANYRFLAKNVALNGLEASVRAFDFALGGKRSRASAGIEPGGAGNAVIGASDIQHPDTPGSFIEVNVEPLDDVRDLPDLRCSLLKMDVEGFEIEALNGAERFVAANRPVIFGEFEPTYIEARGLSADAPQEWASRHRYLTYELVYTRPRPLTDRRVIRLHALSRQDERQGTALLLVPEESAAADDFTPGRSPHPLMLGCVMPLREAGPEISSVAGRDVTIGGADE